MKSKIVILKNNGQIDDAAIYSLPPKEALVAFVMQYFDYNFNTWEYPDIIKGMWESSTVPNHWYWEWGDVVYGSYEVGMVI